MCSYFCVLVVFFMNFYQVKITSENIVIHKSCLWCNGYCRRKWTRRHEFKSWARLIAFHITLGKGMNPIILPSAIDK